jgi:uncharacterized protein with FMN-binding domain
MVFHVKEVVKGLVLALLGLAAVIALAVLFLPRAKQAAEGAPGGSASLYRPGKYISQAQIGRSGVSVAVTVSEDAIESVELMKMAEAQEVFYPLVKPAMDGISREVVASQNADITPPEEYAVTGRLLISAVKDALAEARTAKREN